MYDQVKVWNRRVLMRLCENVSDAPLPGEDDQQEEEEEEEYVQFIAKKTRLTDSSVHI